MQDYNSDREGHRQHKYMVVKANRDPDFKSVKVGEKEYKFGEYGWFRVPGDPKLAQDLRSVVGKDATVTRVNAQPRISDYGHRYFFGALPKMPWHKYDAEGNRIKE